MWCIMNLCIRQCICNPCSYSLNVLSLSVVPLMLSLHCLNVNRHWIETNELSITIYERSAPITLSWLEYIKIALQQHIPSSDHNILYKRGAPFSFHDWPWHIQKRRPCRSQQLGPNSNTVVHSRPSIHEAMMLLNYTCTDQKFLMLDLTLTTTNNQAIS